MPDNPSSIEASVHAVPHAVPIDEILPAKQSRRYRVEQILDQVDPETREGFYNYLRSSPSDLDVQRYLKEVTSQTASVSAIQSWRKSRSLNPKEAEALEKMLTACKGVDPLAGKEWLLSEMLGVVNGLFQHLQDTQTIRSLDDPIAIMSMVPQLSRELRALSDSISNERFIRDRRELELAGGYRVAELIRSRFENTPIADVIDVALKAALNQFEDEVNRKA